MEHIGYVQRAIHSLSRAGKVCKVRIEGVRHSHGLEGVGQVYRVFGIKLGHVDGHEGIRLCGGDGFLQLGPGEGGGIAPCVAAAGLKGYKGQPAVVIGQHYALRVLGLYVALIGLEHVHERHGHGTAVRFGEFAVVCVVAFELMGPVRLHIKGVEQHHYGVLVVIVIVELGYHAVGLVVHPLVYCL